MGAAVALAGLDLDGGAGLGGGFAGLRGGGFGGAQGAVGGRACDLRPAATRGPAVTGNGGPAEMCAIRNSPGSPPRLKGVTDHGEREIISIAAGVAA